MSAEIAPFMGEEKEHLIQFAKEELKRSLEINYFIFGHRHIMLNYPLKEDSNIVILGDWMSCFSYAVFDGKTVELKQFEKD